MRSGHILHPSSDGINHNVLILLHGLGDKPAPFAKLAQQLALPQTASLALPGPLPVPETGGGRAWMTAFDDDWELIQVSYPGRGLSAGACCCLLGAR
jgi:predicted esterase